MLELGMRAVGVRRSEVAVIGDRLDTDVVVAKKLKLRSILVLSGVSTPQDVRKARHRGLSPDFVFRTLAEVVS
jgi:ribonucleotide monophosphatase NagD (HAD superfamily)